MKYLISKPTLITTLTLMLLNQGCGRIIYHDGQGCYITNTTVLSHQLVCPAVEIKENK